MSIESSKVEAMMDGKTLEQVNIQKMYQMVQSAEDPETKKNVMKHSVFFVGQLPLKEHNRVDVDGIKAILYAKMDYDKVDACTEQLVEALSIQKLLLKQEDGSYEVNTKYEKSILKVRKIAKAYEAELEKSYEAALPKAKKMYQMGTKYYNQASYEEAAACFMNAVKMADYRMAYYSIAMMYFEGKGVDKSLENALFYASNAVLKGGKIAEPIQRACIEKLRAIWQ